MVAIWLGRIRRPHGGKNCVCVIFGKTDLAEGKFSITIWQPAAEARFAAVARLCEVRKRRPVVTSRWRGAMHDKPPMAILKEEAVKVFETLDELVAATGTELGPTDWLEITQETRQSVCRSHRGSAVDPRGPGAGEGRPLRRHDRARLADAFAACRTSRITSTASTASRWR